MEIQRFDLARLPRALVPASLGLGGTVDADVALRDVGGGGAPRIDAKASLTGGRIRGHRDLSLALSATVAGGRARGRLSARPGDGGHCPVRFSRAAASAAAARPDAWTSTSRTSISRLAAAIAAATTGKAAAARPRTGATRRRAPGGTRPQLTVAAAALKLRDDHAIGDLTLDVTATARARSPPS